MRLTTFVHLRFTLHHVVTLHICTFPVRTLFKQSNVSTEYAQDNVDVSLAKAHCNAGVHKSVARGRHVEWIEPFKAYWLRDALPV